MTVVQKDRFIKNETPFGDLPEGWESTSLKTVATLKKGKKPYKVDKTTWPGAVPYIDIEAFEKGNIRRYADQESSALVNEGDIIVVWDGARCGHVGKTPERGALGSTLGTIQPILIHPDYILRFLQLSYESINTNPRGIGIPHVEPELFWNLEIPLAPLAEQKRIVAKVEELLTRVNATKERLAKVSMILKRFRQAVLATTCSGRLTEAWREARGDTNRNKWVTVDFFDFCVLQRGYDLPIAKRDDGPFPIVTSGGIIAYHAQHKMSGPGVLVGRSGSIGKVFYVEDDFWPHNTTLFVKDFKGNVPKYVYYFLLGFDFQQFSASTAVPTLNRNNLRDTTVEVPPVEEQHEIVRQVEAMFKLADAVKKRVAAAKVRSDKLTQAILAKAFRGELVPTEAELARRERRPYEPASDLLARIKSDKEMNEISVKLHHKLDHKKRSK